MFAAFPEIDAAFSWFFPACATIFGLMVGSFLNVVIYRVPAEKSIVTPGSHCACGQPIKWRDNIPVLSWLLLRGRARCCGRNFSFRYPFVELLTGALFLLCWLKLPAAVAVVGWVFVSCLVCATFIDLDHMIIPDVFTLGLGVLGVFLSLLVPALHGQHSEFFALASLRAGTMSLQGLLVGSGLVLWIALLAEFVFKKEAMGFGDVKFVGAIGAFLGWQGAVTSVFGGAVVGTVWFIVALIWQKIAGQSPAPAALKSETPEGEPTALGFGAQVPFGPMLAIAAAVHFLFLRGYVATWFAQFGELF
ncbi:MAG: prepilin peptidase [Undibacterium sp.]|nr:prepilin peptidase [Opitutaceae bacterium]